MVTRFMQVDIGSIVSTATSFIDATVIGTSTFGAVKTVSVAAVLPDSVIFRAFRKLLDLRIEFFGSHIERLRS